jgi:hypothetical protein
LAAPQEVVIRMEDKEEGISGNKLFPLVRLLLSCQPGLGLTSQIGSKQLQPARDWVGLDLIVQWRSAAHKLTVGLPRDKIV